MANSVRIKFRGVRAIHSAPGHHNQTTGGNTSCIQIDDGSSTIFVNAGFGISAAGSDIMSARSTTGKNVDVSILFSDFLWDSTIGFLSFAPIHFKSSKIQIVTGSTVATAIDGLDDAASPFFSPFENFRGLSAKKSFIQIHEGLKIGGWDVSGLLTNNPLTPYGATIWRLKNNKGDDIGIVMLCDRSEDTLAKVGNFLSGCKTLICAATAHPEHDSWSEHRTGFEEALTLALAAKTEALFLTHFHPELDDVILQEELIKLKLSLASMRKDNPSVKLSIYLANEIEDISLATSTLIKKAI